MSRAPALEARVQTLRDEFDRAFAQAPDVRGVPSRRFLGLRVDGDRFALPVAEIAGLHVDRKIVPVPGPSPTLLGIASFRGTMVAVHDLHRLLGYGAGGPRRWLVLARPGRPIGLAFGQLDEHFEGDLDSPLDAPGPTRRHTRGAARTQHHLRPVVDVASVLVAIARQNEGNPSPLER